MFCSSFAYFSHENWHKKRCNSSKCAIVICSVTASRRPPRSFVVSSFCVPSIGPVFVPLPTALAREKWRFDVSSVAQEGSRTVLSFLCSSARSYWACCWSALRSMLPLFAALIFSLEKHDWNSRVCCSAGRWPLGIKKEIVTAWLNVEIGSHFIGRRFWRSVRGIQERY